MKFLSSLFACIIVFSAFGQTDRVHAGFRDFVEDISRSLSGEKGLTDSDIVKGLKEALRVGTGNAVDITSKIDGYYKNPDIKIPLPDSVKKVESALRIAGYGSKVDNFVLSMNRAAERAAPEAKSIFWKAIKQITFSDARKILKGSDNAATLYFKDKTWGRLEELFKPVVHNTMSEVGVTRSYQELESSVRSIPFADRIVNFNLDDYVTDKALDGLFLMLSKEEEKIRKDPSARVTDILKKVFGSQE